MSPTQNCDIVITGANRGLGRGLLAYFLQKDNQTIIALNRNPDTAKNLQALPTGNGSRVLVVPYDATNATSPAKAVSQLEKEGIDHVDVVIANAGISQIWPSIEDLNVWDLQRHLHINVYSIVWLWQAFLPLPREAKAPKMVTAQLVA